MSARSGTTNVELCVRGRGSKYVSVGAGSLQTWRSSPIRPGGLFQVGIFRNRRTQQRGVRRAMAFLHKPNTLQCSVQDCSGRRCAASQASFRQDAPLAHSIAQKPNGCSQSPIQQPHYTPQPPPCSHACPRPLAQNVTVPIPISQVHLCTVHWVQDCGSSIQATRRSSTFDIVGQAFDCIGRIRLRLLQH